MDEQDLDRPSETLEANLKRILSDAIPARDAAFEKRLMETVQGGIDASQTSSRRRWVRWVVALAAAAAILVVALAADVFFAGPRIAGQVKCVYGIVTIRNGGAPRAVAGSTALLGGEHVSTAWGSKAAITLGDKSTVEAGVHTTAKFDEGTHGATVTLEEGALKIVAAKQKAGKALLIDTPGAKVTVLGTVLDVSVGDREGAKETSVSVLEGRVEVASAGQSLLLPHGTVGAVVEGQPPVRRSRVAEVNEMLDLQNATAQFARERQATPAYPCIIDLSADGNAAVWLYVPVANKTSAAMAKCTLSAASLLSEVKVFSPEGSPLPTRNLGAVVEVDLAETPIAPGQSTLLVVKAASIAGLFKEQQSGVFEFSSEGEPQPVVRIVEFRLPETATVTSASPEPLPAQRALGRLVVKVVCNAKYPQIVK